MPAFVEPCAGSAAVARRLCGLGPLVGFMGAKDGYAEAILAEWKPPAPSRVVLNDPGLWGLIWEGVVADCSAVASALRELSVLEPREAFELAAAIMPDDQATARSAALALCRIAGSYCGSEVGGFKGRHKLRPNAEGFTPSRLKLAERVERLVWPVPVVVRRGSAADMRVPVGSWVYIDPPYRDVKGYLNDLDRDDVVRLARRCAGAARSVAVSEGERLAGLTDWRVVDLTDRRRGQARRHSRSREERLTISRQPVGVRW